MFNAPSALLAARALTGEHLRPPQPDRPRRAAEAPAAPAPQPAAETAADKPRRRRHGRGRLAWR
jgi:hypothetical protein